MRRAVIRREEASMQGDAAERRQERRPGQRLRDWLEASEDDSPAPVSTTLAEAAPRPAPPKLVYGAAKPAPAPAEERPRRQIGRDRITSYADWVIRFRWLVIVAVLVASIAAAAGAHNLGFSTDYRVFFSDENPYLKNYTAIQNVYTKDDNILLVLTPRDGNVFSPQVLSAVRELTEAAWQVPYASRVDSLTNFQHSTARGDDVAVGDLVPKGVAITPALAERTRRTALAEPMLVGRMVSRDGKATAVNISLALPQKAMDEIPRAMDHARKRVNEFRAAHPDIGIATTGGVALSYAFIESTLADLVSLIPLMYVIIIAGVAAVLRSATGAAVTIAVIALSAATAMGLAGWVGIQLNPASAPAPMIITTIAVGDAVHILVTVLRERRHGADKRTAIVDAMRVNFYPCFLTTLTTVIGFLSLNSSDSPPLRDLGNLAAVGTFAAWILAMTLLPAMLAVLPLGKGRIAVGHVPLTERIAEYVLRRRRFLLAAMAALTVAAVSGIPRIELNDQFVRYFAPSIAFRADSDYAKAYLPGIYQMEFSIESGTPGGIADPAYLATLDAFAAWMRQQRGVAHVQTIADILKRLNRNMHGDEPAWFRLPSERDLAAQYLILFEMSLPAGLDLKNQINVDRSATRVVALLDDITTREARELKSAAEDWLARNRPNAPRSEAAGALVLFTYISERNNESMLVGTAIALVLIAICLVATLRNLRFGLISLVPNATPAVVAFGTWGYLVGEVGMSASVVAAATLGLIVDNTIHFISKYQHARRDLDASPDDAVRYAFATVGTAALTSTIILMAGFATLALSTFQINETLGLLTVIVLFVALLTDFFLLPPLLGLIDREKTREPGIDLARVEALRRQHALR
jgi:hypothetical protein